jgi:hypothetical protein
MRKSSTLNVSRYSSCFKRGLEHPNASVKEAHLKVLRKCMRSSSGMEELLANPK